MRVLRLVFLGVFAFSIFFASWYVLHEDLYFGADQARDFHILREIDEKKIIIIGPRASGDLFHGPGWPYLNYPLFVLGSGNPVAVGWGWVILTLFSGGIAYYVGKKLFDIKVGYLFGTMTVLYTAFHAKGMINPHGVMLLLPLFFYFFVKYFQTSNQKFLALNLIVGGIMIQMELMSVPLLALSVGAMSFKIIKEKKLRHLTSLLLIFLFLFLTTFALLISQIRNNKHRLIYLSFLYFYFGYYILSLINKGQVLYFHQFPLFPLVFLVFSSFITSKYSKLFLILFFVVLSFNLRSTYLDIKESESFIGNDKYSWKFLNEASQKVFQGPEKVLGYFVYAPDVLAYEPKYAMIYNAEKSGKDALYFQKKAITYLLIQPPPPNDPFMTENFWITDQVGITSSPSAVINFPNGYKIQKHILTDEDINRSFDP